MEQTIIDIKDLLTHRSLEPTASGTRREVHFGIDGSNRTVLKKYKTRIFPFNPGEERELLNRLQPTVQELNQFHLRVKKIYEDPKIIEKLGVNTNYINGVFRLVRDNQSLRLITFETDRRDIYPSYKNPERVTDISGMEEKLETAFRSGQIADYLRGESTPEFLNNAFIKDLQAKLENTLFKNALIAFLESTRNLKDSEGVVVDLMGKDNLVIVQNGNKFEPILNNSALKCDMRMKPDFYINELLQKLNDLDSKMPTRYIAYFCKFILSINLLCKLAGIPEIYHIDEITLNKMKICIQTYYEQPETSL